MLIRVSQGLCKLEKKKKPTFNNGMLYDVLRLVTRLGESLFWLVVEVQREWKLRLVTRSCFKVRHKGTSQWDGQKHKNTGSVKEEDSNVLRFKFYPTGRRKGHYRLVWSCGNTTTWMVATQKKGLGQRVLLWSQAPISMCPAYWDIQNLQLENVEQGWRSTDVHLIWCEKLTFQKVRVLIQYQKTSDSSLFLVRCRLFYCTFPHYICVIKNTWGGIKEIINHNKNIDIKKEDRT